MRWRCPGTPKTAVVTRPFWAAGRRRHQACRDRLPRQGTHGPWKASQDYLTDVKILRFEPIEDGYLEFDGQRSLAGQSQSTGFLRPLRSALFGS